MTKAPKKKTSQRLITSLAAFARRVEAVTLDWAPEREFDPWFRGHCDTDWRLVPAKGLLGAGPHPSMILLRDH